jgi:phosphoribosylanthranilate isomerase
MKVKICGVRTYDEVMDCIEAGADMIGFNFYRPSPRNITPGACMRLMVQLEMALREELAEITVVGVFVNENRDFLHAVFRDCHLDLIQLSGDEPPDLLESLGERAFKVLRLTTPEALDDAARLYRRGANAPAWLVDAGGAGAYGGTGEAADWNLARQLAERAPILLAGGLRPDNVAEAIRQVNPWGVDVASGVESEPGVKDPRKVRAFIRAVRSYEEEHETW